MLNYLFLKAKATHFSLHHSFVLSFKGSPYVKTFCKLSSVSLKYTQSWSRREKLPLIKVTPDTIFCVNSKVNC